MSRMRIFCKQSHISMMLKKYYSNNTMVKTIYMVETAVNHPNQRGNFYNILLQKILYCLYHQLSFNNIKLHNIDKPILEKLFYLFIRGGTSNIKYIPTNDAKNHDGIII